MGKELAEMNSKGSIYRFCPGQIAINRTTLCDRSHIQRKRDREQKPFCAIDRPIGCDRSHGIVRSIARHISTDIFRTQIKMQRSYYPNRPCDRSHAIYQRIYCSTWCDRSPSMVRSIARLKTALNIKEC